MTNRKEEKSATHQKGNPKIPKWKSLGQIERPKLQTQVEIETCV